MSLSKAEMAELESLRKEQGQIARKPGQVSEMSYLLEGSSGNSIAPAQESGLTKEEEAELLSLRQEQSQAPQESSLGDRAQTQLESFGNMISFGHLPQIQAAFEKINPDPSGGLDAKLREQGFTVPGQDYVNLRDENIKRQRGQAERNPYDAAAGTVAGIAVQAPLIASGASMLGMGKAATVIGRGADAVKTGFGLGVISNPGDTEGQVNPFQGQDRLEGGGKGVAFGIAGQGLGEGVSKIAQVVKNAPSALSKFAGLTAFKSIGAGKPDFKKAFGRNAPEEVGETLIKLGIVKPGATVESMLPEIQAIKQSTGQELGSIYKGSTEFLKNPANTNKLNPNQRFLIRSTQLDGAKLSKVAEARITKEFKNSLDNSQVKDRVLSIFDNLKNSGDDIQITDMHEMIVKLDDSINWSQQAREATVIQDQLRSVRQVLHKSLQNRVKAVGRALGDPDQLKKLQEANKQYGQMATAERVAKNKIVGENANRYFSLTDYLAGGVLGGGSAITDGDNSPEGLVKKGVLFAAGAIANKGMRKYSLPIVATTAKRLSEALQKPAAFAKYGEPLIEAAKRSPQEFQALINQFGKEPAFIKLTTQTGTR